MSKKFLASLILSSFMLISFFSPLVNIVTYVNAQAACDQVGEQCCVAGGGALVCDPGSGLVCDTSTSPATCQPNAGTPSTSVGTWYRPTLGEFLSKVDGDPPDEIFGERYTFAQVVWIWYSLIAVLLPKELVECFVASQTPTIPVIGQCLGDAGKTLGLIGYSEKPSLASTINQTVSSAPASGIGYVRNTLSRLHFIPEVKAQAGFGFGTLSPIQQIWGVVRNTSYFLMVIAFVVLAFMIMFRVKISPQTVITIQSAIPRLIMILIFITFSYAIAGFIIDLSYALVGLLALVAANVSDKGATELFQLLLNPTAVFLSMAISLLIYILAIIFTPGGIGTLLGAFLGLGPILVILQVVLFLILIAIFVIVWLRVIWVIFRTFINVVLLIIFGPILILTGVFPGSGGFSGWIRNLMSQMAIFPGVIAMLFLAHFIFWGSLDNASTLFNDQLFLWIKERFPDTFNPLAIKLIGTNATIQLPGFNLPSGGFFGFLVAFGILMLIPSITNIIQSAISGRPFGYGTAIGAALATGWAIGGAPISYPYGLIRGGYEKKILDTIASEGWRGIFSAFRSGGSSARRP